MLPPPSLWNLEFGLGLLPMVVHVLIPAPSRFILHIQTGFVLCNVMHDISSMYFKFSRVPSSPLMFWDPEAFCQKATNASCAGQ